MKSYRSQLGRVRGLGSAKHGTEHWWAQRLNSLALIPLTLWFVISVIALLGAPYEAVLLWLHKPWHAILMVLLVAATFHHTALGLQVVIEDYVHNEWAKVAGIIVVKGLSFLLATASIFSVLRIAFAG